MASGRTVVADLLERERELAKIGALLASAAAGAGGGVLVQGPSGIGKTRLLEAAREAAGDDLVAGVARGGEFERNLAYGVVRQLFEPLMDSLPGRVTDQLFGGAATLARRALDPGAETGADPGPVREALFHLALRLSRRHPVLIVVDDLNWADEASLMWLLHLARRIERLALAFLVARRTDEPGQSRVVDEIDGEPAVDCLEPAPLSQTAVAHLVHSAFGDHSAGSPVDVWHEVSGGNPFLLHELLREAGNRGSDLDVRELAPSGVAQSVRERLARLPPEARGFARAMAVLERALKIDDPCRLAGIDRAAGSASADVLVSAGVLADREALEFVHPLVRQAVYADLPPGERAAQHERAALLMAERGEIEHAAAHVLTSRRSPEPWAVEVLRGAAATATSRGAPDVAVRQLECALHAKELGASRTAVLGELGLAELRTFDARGFDHLRQAIDATSDVSEAARLAVPTARALTVLWRHREAVELLEPVLARLPTEHAMLRRALEGELITTASADTQTAPLARERLSEMLSREGSSPADDPVVWGIAAMGMAAAGAQRLESVEIARQAIDGGRIGDAFASALPYPSIALVWAGEIAAAEAAWEAALDRASRAGSTLEGALARCYLAICANARGDCLRAEAYAAAALEACVEAGVPAGPNPLAPLADALVDRGAASAALSMLGTHVDGRTETSVSFPLLLFSRGRARIASGDRAGVEDVLEAGRRLVAQGAANPAGAPWRSVAGLCLESLGEARRGRDLIGEELELAEAFGAPIPIGIALTARASLGDSATADALESARGAVRALRPTPARRAFAEALACEGRTLHAAGRHVEARAPLREALDIAHRLGAAPLAERVRARLIASGARPRRPALSGPDSLTPRERRVAQLAAEGHSSRDIADELVVSIRTVDLHLSNAYRKLGIGGRAGLREALER